MTTANAMEMVKALVDMVDELKTDPGMVTDTLLLEDARDMIDEFYGEDG